jgi:hypothetical protein
MHRTRFDKVMDCSDEPGTTDSRRPGLPACVQVAGAGKTASCVAQRSEHKWKRSDAAADVNMTDLPRPGETDRFANAPGRA